MKYDISLDPGDDNTSHVQVLDLVGTGKRVLDVGCSTGYLAAALAQRGNTVTGVELDPEAGELARPHLEQLVIGDLESMDLVAELGEHRFDVVVFADVLEHLSDPLRILRQAPSLLTAGGSVVISIPNVAHGAVRLALLQGRFDYHDLGLLDTTHLRFFTRTSLEDLHHQAGLVPVEHRRTVADPFGTEIRLRPSDFPETVVERVNQDPDATTYQFVVRSVAAGEPQGDEPDDRLPGDLGAELVARNEEIAELRAQLRRVSEVVARTTPPTVAILRTSAGERTLDELRAMVVTHELRRRLPGWWLDQFEWSATEPRPAVDGAPIRPFAADGPPMDRASTQVEAAVLCGGWPAAAVGDTITRAAEDGCPVHVAAVVGPRPDDLPRLRPPSAVAGWSASDRRSLVADPLVLALRAQDRTIATMRSQYLVATGALPARPYVLVAASTGQPAALGRALDLAAKDLDLDVAVVADTDRDPGGVFAKAVGAEGTRSTVATEGVDAAALLGAIADARLVVSDDPGVLWLALAARRPFVGLDSEGAPGMEALAGWLGDPDVAVTSPAAIGQAVPLAERRVAAPVERGAVDELDAFFDELADAVAGQVSARSTASLPTLLAEASHRANTLEAVNQGLRHRMLRLTAGFADVARRSIGQAGHASVNPADHHQALQRLAAAETEMARLQAEVGELSRHIQATENTITMRTLRPARRVYGRLRRQ